MSKIHILNTSLKKDSADVVYHIAVPDVDNAASISYREALVEYLDPEGVGITSAVADLSTKDATHYAGLQNGSILEVETVVKFDATITNGAKATIIDNDFLAKSASFLSSIQNRLEFWGMTRDPS